MTLAAGPGPKASENLVGLVKNWPGHYFHKKSGSHEENQVWARSRFLDGSNGEEGGAT